MDNPKVVTTQEPTVGTPALNNTERVDSVASTFATMAAEAQQHALGYNAELQAEVLAQVARETPERRRQAQQ